MGFVGDMLGFGGNTGANFRASGASILNPTNLDQTNAAYGQAQSGLGQQQSFLNSLAAQNGIGNQASVFGQQQALANQLQGVANGTGPNPALQQLQNTTGQNVANQAALMAGQRGAGANAGLLARQAAQQGAGIQQQAAGQGAALQAQQQLNAMSALQGQQGMMGNLAGQQVGQQANALLGYNQAAQAEQNALLGSVAQQNNANVGMQSNINNANAGIAQGVQGQQGSLMGTLGGLGAAAMLMNKGGEVKNYDAGGFVADSGPASFAGKFLSGWSQPSFPGPIQATALPASPPSNQMSNTFNSISGQAKEFKGAQNEAKGGVIKGEMLVAKGKMVPGSAKVKGDSVKNDNVPAMLSPGEIVIPRSVMQSNDPVNNAAKFVAAIMAKHGRLK